MRKRGRILLAASLLAVTGLVWWQITGEPRYHGRSLSSWLKDYGAGPHDYKPSARADDAVRHIGPKAVPYLLQMLRSTNNNYHTRITRKPAPQTNSNMIQLLVLRAQQESVVAQKPWMKAVEKYTPFRVERTVIPARWSHWKAYLAFQALGPAGKSATPELAKMVYQNPDENSNPSGTGMAPNVAFWKKMDTVATMARQSLTYSAPGGSPIPGGWRLGNSPMLVDGEIAAWSLAAIGGDSVPVLMEMLQSPNARLRGRAVTALGLIGPPAEPAVPMLLKKLEDTNSDIRWQSADALGWICRKPEIVVPALTKALADRNVAMKFSAMDALGKFGSQASNAVPTLLTLLPADDKRIGDAAAVAISKISRETTRTEIIPLFITHLKNSPGTNMSYRRYLVLETLGKMTNEPDAIVPILTEALGDTDESPRIAAIRYLGDFGPAAKPAVAKLAPFAASSNTNVSRLAVTALDKIDPSWRSGH